MKLLLRCKPLLLFFIFIPSYLFAQSAGIGVILEYLPEKKIHRVKAVFQGSPAAKARIQAGDEIVSVEGLQTSQMSFEELGKKIRGNAGEGLNLSLKNSSTGEVREVRLIRVSNVSPLITPPAGSTPLLTGTTSQAPLSTSTSGSPTLTDEERNHIKAVIRKLKTPEDQKKMEQLLKDFRDGKLIKPDFFKTLKALFPAP